MDEEKPNYEDRRGHWIGDHWVIKRTGYCKACDGPCDNAEAVEVLRKTRSAGKWRGAYSRDFPIDD